MATTRSDLVILVGLVAMIYAGTERLWPVFSVGALLLLVGLFAPRMKGPFSFGGSKLSFKGELTDPDGPRELTQPRDVQPARPLPPEPPASSPRQMERQR
jgi:hypothetical protein